MAYCQMYGAILASEHRSLAYHHGKRPKHLERSEVHDELGVVFICLPTTYRERYKCTNGWLHGVCSGPDLEHRSLLCHARKRPKHLERSDDILGMTQCRFDC